MLDLVFLEFIIGPFVWCSSVAFLCDESSLLTLTLYLFWVQVQLVQRKHEWSRQDLGKFYSHAHDVDV